MLSSIGPNLASTENTIYILPYIMYIYIHEHLFYFVDYIYIYICVAGKHIVGPTIKVQHRNKHVRKKPVSIHIIQSVRRIVTCCYTAARSSMDGRFAKFCIIKVKVVLYSAVSSPLDRSKRFTLFSSATKRIYTTQTPTECSQCDGCWHCCCIFLVNCLNYGQSGEMDNRAR